MKKSLILVGILAALSLASCGSGNPTSESISGPSGSQTSTTSKPSSSGPVQPGHTEEEIREYMNNLKNVSEGDHFYVHYYRFKQTAVDYNDWDIWSWAYKPKAGEGYKFDWFGRTTSPDVKYATGDAKMDNFGYVHVDIDLTKTYNGGWDNKAKTIGGTPANYYQEDGVTLDEQIGIQIVMSATRDSSSSFWKNDGSNLYVTLDDYALENKDGTTSYHVFVTQDKVQEPTPEPPSSSEDPFAKDDGTNYTYGKKEYSNVDWSQDKAIAKTSPSFLDGGNNSPLKNGAGVGYQIMVSSFADSDGDGSGDIYGITKKIPYLKDLGVNVLWLTPIQLSDSYHGYDISDYTQVDPKFGSKVSTYSLANMGVVDSNSAMEDYKELLKVAHENGMAVVMDLVLNHTSTTNHWFIKSAQLDAAHRGYYQWGNNKTQADKIKEENYWYPYGDHVYSYYAKFGSSMPELNYAYVSTRAAVISMAKNWCEIGVDGFRMDAVKHIFMDDEVQSDARDTIVKDISESGNYSSNITKNMNFWRELNYEVKKDYPNAFFVGENFDGHAYHVAPYYEGFDSLFDFYTYFNLTSVAARSFRNGNSGAFATPVSDFLGDYNVTYGNPYDPSKDADLITNNPRGTIKYGASWNLKDVYNTNNQYRGGKVMNQNSTNAYTMIGGSFTSNHDIARAINRIAGNTWSANGLEAQGNVSKSDYTKLDQLATCYEIAELMLPGCTWIYYGDELGMTGNFPKGVDANTGYADLWYRQPMKWTADKSVDEDGIFTTSYGVTGSSMIVKWDEINSTSTVKSACEQKGKAGTHYEAIKAFATAKGTTPTLIKGNFVPWDWKINNVKNDYIINFQRKLGSEVYTVVVNLSNVNATAGFKGTVVASYNGATLSSIPARSAILIKEK